MILASMTINQLTLLLSMPGGFELLILVIVLVLLFGSGYYGLRRR